MIGLALFFGSMTTYVAWPIILDSIGGTAVGGQGFAIETHPAELVRERVTTTITGLWFFVFGATIGSFLNVVAYRMPMGLSFVSKPSRCPYCETPILFKHNVPILGWLVLRGRCKACRLPISPRYILVELVVGVMFFILFWAELASGGRNLPFRVPESRPGVMWNLFTPQWDLIALYAFHAFLIGVLATIALIKFDKLRIPFRLGLFALVVGIVARSVWPDLSVLPSLGVLSASVPHQFADPIIDLGIGLAVGAITQLQITVVGRHRFIPSCCGSLAGLSLVAVYLGWQAVVPVLMLAALCQLAFTVVGRVYDAATSGLWGISLLVGAWLTLCFWRQLPSVWLPGAESELIYQVGGLLLGLATAFVAESWAKPASDVEMTDT
jgi:leader peptidase (prepilin peptidase)/N-methyltransferase